MIQMPNFVNIAVLNFKNMRVLFFISILLALISCKQSEQTTISNDPTHNDPAQTSNKGDEPKTNPDEQPEPNGRILYNPKLMNTKGDHKDISGITLDGNILNIEVSYSGGCKEHSFELVHKKEMTKSMPPILTVYLIHHANEDYCEEYITEKLKFDISKLPQQVSENEITLSIVGARTQITYKVK